MFILTACVFPLNVVEEVGMRGEAAKKNPNILAKVISEWFLTVHPHLIWVWIPPDYSSPSSFSALHPFYAPIPLVSQSATFLFLWHWMHPWPPGQNGWIGDLQVISVVGTGVDCLKFINGYQVLLPHYLFWVVRDDHAFYQIVTLPNKKCDLNFKASFCLVHTCSSCRQQDRVAYRVEPKSGPLVVRISPASWDKSGKQQQEPNSHNLTTTSSPSL